MSEFARSLEGVTLEKELSQSYLDYAMSVIVGRALPDVRDGLKPVHRRVLFAMNELRNYADKPHKKSARVVGDVIGKYHPHGETAVYDAIVRLAQDFSMRYPLVDGQGNFGSIDGDAPAAMRYTEIRMDKIAHLMLESLDKNTVDFVPNYDNSEQMPDVLPTRFPNLLVNGSSGIAVGMATNIPPHNLVEVINACIATIDQPEIDLDGLMEYITGPDFPTAGIINGLRGIRDAYATGRGKVYIRAKVDIETDHQGKEAIVITELPYQVNKARLLEKVAQLVKEKKVEGITGIRDESDKDGMRAVIEVRRGENAEVLLNQLYKNTQLQVVFGINMVALHRGQPKCMALKEIIEAFIQHRQEVVTRRTRFDLNKARNRSHLLEGLALALSHVNEMIALIQASKTPEEAKQGLLAKNWSAELVASMLPEDISLTRPVHLESKYGMQEGTMYRLSPEQAQAILDLKLHRLTGLERDKITNEYKELIEHLRYLMAILASPARLMEVVKEELVAIKDQFSEGRRTEITHAIDINDEDLIPKQELVVTVTNEGYTKTQELEVYQAQKRGGRGKSSAQTKEDDYIQFLQIANSHDTLLFFTSRGRVYWLKVYQLPLTSRNAKGRPINNFIPLEKDENITAMVPIDDLSQGGYLLMTTAAGVIKKCELSHFSRPRKGGVIAIDLDDDDALIAVEQSTGDQELMLFSNAGKVIRFHESAIRAVGRTARGVRGIKLQSDQRCVAMIVVDGDDAILTATENGYGKRTPLDQYRVTQRGGQGVISIQVSERNGSVIGALQVKLNDEVMMISDGGILIRTPVESISEVGRNTQGVRLIRLGNDEHLIGLQGIGDVEVGEEGESIEEGEATDVDEQSE